MSESTQEKKTRGRSASLVEEDEHEIEEAEKQSEGSGGIHDDLIDAVARGTEDPEVLREQDRFLPICNIARIMRRMVPESGKMSKESKEAIQEAVSEFISFITSEASDKCIEEQRKTITCDDLLNAFEVMGFEKYVEPLKLFMTRYRDATRADRPSGEGGDIRTPSPPLSTPLSIPIPAPFPHSASGPGGPIQPAPSHSLPSSTGLLSTAAGPMRISLPPGFVLGEKGSILYKGPAKAANVYQPSQQVVALEGVSMGGEGEGMEEGANGQPHGNSPFLPTTPQGPSSSSEGPITIFVDQSTGQKYRSVIGQDGTQRLTPVRGANQNIKMIRRGAPPPSNRTMDSPQPGPSSSLVDHHQSSQISSTTPHSTHSHYHAHSSYSQSVQSHQSHPPTQYHNTTNHPLPYHGSSSSTSHSSLPAPPPSSSSTNYIQLMPHSGVSSTYPPTTTPHQQYTQYQEQQLMSDGTNVGREEKRPMTSSIANAKWNPSSGQYVVDAPKIGGELSAKRRRVNNKEQ